VIVPLNNRAQTKFYDWETDPTEQQDRFSENRPRALSMLELVDQYLNESEPPWGVPSPTIELDELQLNQLRALGYKLGDPVPKGD
jgi:hypothetical protein